MKFVTSTLIVFLILGLQSVFSQITRSSSTTTATDTVGMVRAIPNEAMSQQINYIPFTKFAYFNLVDALLMIFHSPYNFFMINTSMNCISPLDISMAKSRTLCARARCEYDRGYVRLARLATRSGTH